MSHMIQPLAEVKVTKMKECLMLTASTITPLIMQFWNLACKQYKKHGGKTDTEIVSYVTKGMLNWSHEILKTILSLSQGNHIFIDGKIETENLSVILTTLALTQALTKEQLKVQLQSHLHPDLGLNIGLKPILATDLTAWTFKVKEQDDCIRAEDAHTQKLIDASTAAHAVCQGKKKDLLS